MRRSAKAKEIIRDSYLLSEEDALASIYESVNGKLCEYTDKGQLSDVTVICDPNFMHELFAYYHWKERNAQNYLEDIFRISGQVFYDKDKLILVPRFLLKMVSEKRSKTGVVTSVVNKQGAEYQNYLLEQELRSTDYHWLEEFGPLEVIGHGHSHPDLGSIGVEPSSIDVTDHRSNLEDHKLWLSHIVDPIRGLTGFYFGPKLKRPKVIYLIYQEDKELFERKQVFFGRISPTVIPEHVHSVLPCDTADTVSEEFVEHISDAIVETDELTTAKQNRAPQSDQMMRNVYNRGEAVETIIPDRKLRRLIQKAARSYIKSDAFFDEIKARLMRQLN